MNGSLRVHDRSMSTAKTSRIMVELETSADPIRGSIEDAGGKRKPFWGWLELIEALRLAADEPELAAQPKPGASAGQPAKADAQAPRRRRQTPGEERS